MSIEIVANKDITLLEEKAGMMLHTVCEEDDVPVFLLLSGGSALNVLTHVVFANGHMVTVCMLDERYSSDLLNNNFLQLKKRGFYERALAEGVTFIDTSYKEGQTQGDLSRSMSNAFLAWKEKHQDGKVVAVLGVGGDGHTAGIMPFPEDNTLFNELFENEKVLVVGYDAKEKNPIPLRVTFTLPFLRKNVDKALVYSVGVEKHEILKKVLEKKEPLSLLPSGILHEMKSVTLFTDITI